MTSVIQEYFEGDNVLHRLDIIIKLYNYITYLYTLLVLLFLFISSYYYNM